MIKEPIKYIQKVEIQGLFGRYDIEWNLHSDVNVLAGINGSGKTTILDRIYAILSDKSFLKNTFSTKILFNDNMRIESLNEITSKNINEENNNGFYVSMIPRSEDNSEYLVTGMINNLRGPILASIYVNLMKTFDSEAISQERMAKEDKEAKTELDFQLSKLQREYTKYQVRIYKYNSEINRATHTRFLAIVDELFVETQKKINPNKEELGFLLGDKEISAYQLSSGEKQLLIILLTVLVQDNKPSILLMDEPEISLHIEWQRKLIRYIRELNPNVQVIIATHSPDIIMEGWMDKVFNISDIIVKDNATA